jgi:hypothetical protein
MPTKPIERFLFAQGGICFFCNATLAKSEATVEHLVATSRGGSNSDDNCVACCKAINTLLGNMSIKEKIKVVLNQNGQFKCPNAGTKQTTATPLAPKKKPALKSKDPLLAVVKNLKSRSKGRPQKVKKLIADIKSQKLGLSDKEILDLIETLRTQGKLVVDSTKVTYNL